jgi:predicted MPP superfamily phosphohydrolase
MFNQPHIDRLELQCPRLPPKFDGLTVLHLSDLHIMRWTRRLEKWRQELARLEPDVLVITGDLGHRSWQWKVSVESVRRLLEPVVPRLGTFYILGNHDSVKLGAALAETRDAGGKPRVWLQNQAAFLRREGKGMAVELPTDGAGGQTGAEGRVALIGIHQHRRIDTDIPRALLPVRPEDFKLMLLHYPDLVYAAAAAGADVCLAGHTHGGQICWPDGRPLFGQDTLSAAMCTGVHRVKGTWMVVNRGIGSAGLKMRLFCPPHGVMMTLRVGGM